MFFGSVLRPIAFFVFFLCLWPFLAEAQEEKLPLPRFATLDSREVNLRAGPGKDYPILWVYRRKGLPIEIVQEFEEWRRIRDKDGTLGWVQKNLLSGRRNVEIIGQRQVLFSKPQQDSSAVAYLEIGVIARILECKVGDWCKIAIEDYSGWIPRAALWGISKDEIVEAD